MSDIISPSETPAAETPVVEKQEPKVYDEAYVKELRQEAAAARVSKKDAIEALSNELKAQHQAELAQRDATLTEYQNEIAKRDLELEKYRVAVEAKVPSDKVAAFVSILQGDDADSIKASAQAAIELAGGFKPPVPGFDPTQGFGGASAIPLNGDPILDAIKAAVGVK